MRYHYDLEFKERGPNSPIQPYSIGIVCEDGRTFYRETPYSTNTNGAKDWVIKNVFTGFTHYNGKCQCNSKTMLQGHTQTSDVLQEVHRIFERDSRLYQDNYDDCPLVSMEKLKADLLSFFGDDRKIELWGYFSAYDHVVFAQIFGAMDDMPEQFPYYTKDVRQYADHLGFGKFDVPKVGKEHNALNDALWTKLVYEQLRAYHEKHQSIGPAERPTSKRPRLTVQT